MFDNQSPKNKPAKHSAPWHLKRSMVYLGAWLAVCVILYSFLETLGGIDGVILQQPKLFFGLLVLNVYLLATGLNHLISYFAR